MEKTLAKRYAAALLAVSDKEGTVEDTEATLLALREAWGKSPLLRSILLQPKISRPERKRMLRKPFEERSSKTFLRFLDLLVDKNRVELIPEIAEMFDRLADSSKGVVRVGVSSFAPLSEKEESTLQQKLIKITGKKVVLETQTDATLKGGMLLRIGDTVVDGTVARRLKALGERLAELQRR